MDTLYIAARNLQVGDVFYRENVLNKRAPYRVVGVGRATQAYGWRRHKTRELVKVMTEEILLRADKWNDDVTIDGCGFTFGHDDGIWVER